tara:strand:- start:77 stop:304 length:228 start_codon:yes stop_codon:yes gene_type:complete
MAKPPKKTADTPPLHEQMTQLGALLERLEDPEVPLEDALTLYEQGMQLVERAQQTLDAAEQRVTMITPEGKVQTD